MNSTLPDTLTPGTITVGVSGNDLTVDQHQLGRAGSVFNPFKRVRK